MPRSPRHRERDRSRSPPPRSRHRSRSPRRYDDDRRRPDERRRSQSPRNRDLNKASLEEQPPPDPNAGKPNFANSGKLAAETNTFRGVVLKYNEPPEARKPTKSWRLYVFKDEKQLDMIHLDKQSCYLLGRDRLVADIPIEHPSASKQHAVIQFRQVQEKNEFGDVKSLTKPFVIDLESANETQVNDEKIPVSRFYELRSGDVMKFAFSTREYVLLVDPQ